VKHNALVQVLMQNELMSLIHCRAESGSDVINPLVLMVDQGLMSLTHWFWWWIRVCCH